MRRWFILAMLLLGPRVFSQTLYFTNSSPNDYQLSYGFNQSVDSHAEHFFFAGMTLVSDVPVSAPYDLTYSIWDITGANELQSGDFWIVDWQQSYAFTLNSVGQDFSPVANPVPEPSTWSFAILAFGAAGFLHRHRINNKNTKGKNSMLMKFIRKMVDVLAPIGRSGARVFVWLLVLGAVLFHSAAAFAQSNFPDTSTLVTGPQTSFNTALTWVIGATGVLIIIAWIMKAMKRR